jgi:hypothetical protein
MNKVLMDLRPRWAGRVIVWWIASKANEDDAQLKRVARECWLDPVLRDTGNAVADLYGARTRPQLVVIDEHGASRYAAAPDDVSLQRTIPARSYLAEAVETPLQGGAPGPHSTTPYGCAIVR